MGNDAEVDAKSDQAESIDTLATSNLADGDRQSRN